MSGHSKWSKIQRQKGAADTKKGALFTKLANTITLAASEGGGEIDMNFKLKLAVDQARSANMPKDNIERAIKRGTGEIAGGPIEELRYEGFGPEKVAIIIDSLTDNRNRALSEIKNVLNKNGGSIAGQNAVSWQFESKGVIRLPKPSFEKKEELELTAIDAGADDIGEDDDSFLVYTDPKQLQKVKENLEQANQKIEYAEIEMIPKEKVKMKNPDKLEQLFSALDECADVNNYYTNADI
ncbi:YebC/PmpR family DNA-binding transcriptional regulator [Patescibacteria group bacterium]|nr:YebC/PmpR family DNA-binding transcriptional regulator [Patescibacteria group bacterium]